MTCKDCIHYDVCKADEHDLPDYLQCDYFKDKASIVELPCKVGDTVYVIKNNKICAKDIVYYNKIHSRVAEQNEEYWHCVDKDRISINVITFSLDDFGKTVFLTKEEAEAKLKELDENGYIQNDKK